jgi:F-type H+-transporting ATPase subunit b
LWCNDLAGECGLVLFALAETPIQLVPDGTLLFHLAVIAIMVALLNATLLKPINRILTERDRLTKGRLGEAQTTLAAIDAKIREYEQSLREARARSYLLMEQERLAAGRQREQRLEEVRAEISGWLADQKRNVTREADEAKRNLERDARGRAVEISEHILRRGITS